MTALEKHTLGVISTAHISEKTAQLMDKDQLPFTVWKSDYGYFMHVWVPYNQHPSGVYDKMPDDLKTVMTYVWSKGARYLLLDRDGEKHKELPIYDW